MHAHFNSDMSYVLEDALCLVVAPSFYTRWVAAQFSGWQAWLQGLLGLPDSAFVRSGLSASRRPQQASGSSEAAAHEASLPEFSMATAAVLGLCCRWVHHLKADSKQAAQALLAGLVRAAVPAGRLVWPAPLSGEAVGAGSLWPSKGHVVAVVVEQWTVHLQPLVGQHAALRRLASRTLLADTTCSQHASHTCRFTHIHVHVCVSVFASFLGLGARSPGDCKPLN